jgi:DNA processing protein
VTDLLDFISLSLLPSWCWIRIAEALRAGDPAQLVLERLLFEHWHAEADKRAILCRRAEAALRRAAEAGILAVPWCDPSYPVALTTIVDPPPMLWARGKIATVNRAAVAVVGSRAASPYALSVAERLAVDLTRAGLVVVSGLARGVDSAAHRGALVSGGSTIAVLGSGIDVLYPPEHAALASDIEREGAILSELVPGTPPRARFFPQRNRLISGLSRAVVVIEAGEKSGSLITARCALEQGRDVLAVPGNVLSGRNRGAHALLRDGAKIVETADDILEELGMTVRTGRAARSGEAATAREANVDPILECLTVGEPSDLDELSERSGLNPSRLLPRLFELELRGIVARVGGGRFVRIGSSC